VDVELLVPRTPSADG